MKSRLRSLHFAIWRTIKTCEDIQREVWHSQDIDVVPTPMLMAATRTGGIILGAYNSLGDLIGFVFSILGAVEAESRSSIPYMLAVRTAYRNFDVAFKLKMAQRKEALKRKISSDLFIFRSDAAFECLLHSGETGCMGKYL